jgi:predicted PurR-regulated permease PerM
MPNKQIEPQQPEFAASQASLGRNILTALSLVGILLALWLIVLLKPLVLLVLISAVFATGLAPLVARLERTSLLGKYHLPRVGAILITYIIALAIVLGAATLVLVPVVQESVKLSRNLPDYIESAKKWLAAMHHRYPQVPDYAGLLDKARSQLDNAGRYILANVGTAFGVFGGIISVISVLVITFYMLLSYENTRDEFLSLLPARHKQTVSATLSKMAAAMGGWLRAQLILAGIVGVVTALAMFVLGVPYFAVIAVVGAVGELVPMVGPFAAAVPAVLITLFGPVWKLIACVVFFALLAQVESNVLAPRIMQRQVGLSPLVTIIALLAGAILLGIVGALLAIPIAAALRVLFIEIIGPAIRNSTNAKDS